MKFEWDPVTAKSNLRKHGISFDEATTVFGDTLSLTIPDPLGSLDETRLITIGLSVHFVTLVVVHTDRSGAIRIISARRATAQEGKTYEETH